MNQRFRNMLDRIGAVEALLIVTLVLMAGRLIVRALFGGDEPLAADPMFMSAAGGAALVIMFALLMWLARWLLSRGGGMLGAARTVLEEAMRMKIALVFIVGLLATLPVLPLALGDDEPLRYRVQSFLSYGFYTVGFLLSMMTIFLACGSLAGEIRDKQIFTVATKPIGRGRFLIGKWLGIVTLNAVLLAVSSAAIYGFAVLYLANQPPVDGYDAVALQEEVLVARVSRGPSEPEQLDAIVDQQYERLVSENPDLIDKSGGERQAKLELRNQALSAWRSIGPLGTQRYVFDTLQPVAARWKVVRDRWQEQAELAKAQGQPLPPAPERQFVQMRYKINTSRTMPDDQINMLVAFNGQVQPLRMIVGTAQTIPVPADFISDDGVLEVAFRNPSADQPTVTFKAGEGLEVLYKADEFTPNFWRAIGAIWLKLAFLAMLGLAAASFLGFPVACLACLLIYVAASASPFLLDAARGFGAGPQESNPLLVAAYQVVRVIALTIAGMLEKYAQFSPGSAVVEGLLFSWQQLLACALWVGVIWTGLTAAIGIWIFRSRELARVQV